MKSPSYLPQNQEQGDQLAPVNVSQHENGALTKNQKYTADSKNF